MGHRHRRRTPEGKQKPRVEGVSNHSIEERRYECRPNRRLAAQVPPNLLQPKELEMVNEIAHPWTISDLACNVGLSRSAFIDRFSQLLSIPPMTYLTRLRMHLAARALVTSAVNMPAIAAQVGYESEAAFSRAFSRELGMPPARYRSMNKPSPEGHLG